MKLGYIRVSTVNQNEARQVKALEKLNLDKVYQEKVSAKDRNRPQLKKMIDYARENDTIYITDFSRIARSTKDLLEIVDTLKEKKVKLVSLKENLDTSTPTGNLMLTMIGAINEFERANLLERQREGIAIAKEKGKYKGRKKIKVDSTFIKHYDSYINREINKVQYAELLDISRPTLDRLLNEYENGNAC